MRPDDGNRKIRIAIVGAGITALHLGHALSTSCPHVDVCVLEAADGPREDGAAVGIGANGQAALRMLDERLYAALLDAGAVRMRPHVRFMVGTGPEAGAKVEDVEGEVTQVVVARGVWLERVRGLLGDGVVRFGRRVVDVELGNAGDVVLRFADGSGQTYDAVVGCDGINSIIRHHVLLPEHPAAVEPFYTKGHNHRAIVPIERAREAFGDEYCATCTQHGWIGDGGFALTDLVDGGRKMQVVCGGVTETPWPHASPVVPWTLEQLAQDLEPWGEIGKGMLRLFEQQPRLFAAAGRLHPETPTFATGRMCIAGDAAQTFGPFLGAGAGQCLEDALMLATFLRACRGAEDLETAFRAYDTMRRPRRQEVARASAESAAILTGRSPGGVSIDGLRRELRGWGRSVWDYDLQAAQKEAVEILTAGRVGGEVASS